VTTQSMLFHNVAKPEAIIEAIRSAARGNGRERDVGRSQVRGCISFYSQCPPKRNDQLVPFLRRVLSEC